VAEGKEAPHDIEISRFYKDLPRGLLIFPANAPVIRLRWEKSEHPKLFGKSAEIA
jgi:hypothetical protein